MAIGKDCGIERHNYWDCDHNCTNAFVALSSILHEGVLTFDSTGVEDVESCADERSSDRPP